MDRPPFDPSDPEALFFCPSCGSAYRDEEPECADCGAALIDRTEAERRAAAYDAWLKAARRTGIDPEAATPLCVLDDAIKESFLRTRLEEEEIQYFVRHEFLQQAYRSLANYSPAQFFVAAVDLRRAQRVIAELEELKPE